MSNYVNWDKISQLQEPDLIRIRESIMVRVTDLCRKDEDIAPDYVNAEISALNELYSMFGGMA